MIDFLSDLIAYPIIGFLSLLDHVVSFSGMDVSNETIDAIDGMNTPNMVAQWRHRINRMLGGSRPYEYYAAQPNQELLSCGCGCGCGCLVAALLMGAFVLFLLML